MATKDRPFGMIPDWAKLGPIGVNNYSYRAEWHCYLQKLAGKRDGGHPTIKLDSPNFKTWQEYFDHHIGGRPKAFQMLVDTSIREMTVPEELPQHFDSSFKPGMMTEDNIFCIALLGIVSLWILHWMAT
jgi:hypothetical protein